MGTWLASEPSLYSLGVAVLSVRLLIGLTTQALVRLCHPPSRVLSYSPMSVPFPGLNSLDSSLQIDVDKSMFPSRGPPVVDNQLWHDTASLTHVGYEGRRVWTTLRLAYPTNC